VTYVQVVVAREAVEIAAAVLDGAELTELQKRSAVILFRAVLRYAAEEGADLRETPPLHRIVDALAYLTGTLPEVARGAV